MGIHPIFMLCTSHFHLPDIQYQNTDIGSICFSLYPAFRKVENYNITGL